jgi:hypothetical protein
MREHKHHGSPTDRSETLDHRRLDRLTKDRHPGLPSRERIFKRTIPMTTFDDLQSRVSPENGDHAERQNTVKPPNDHGRTVRAPTPNHTRSGQTRAHHRRRARHALAITRPATAARGTAHASPPRDKSRRGSPPGRPQLQELENAHTDATTHTLIRMARTLATTRTNPLRDIE